ncbi:MAG: electron transport complex protein RnfC [Thermaerobacter sp.]|nr:electron transport complex protein RnfC [Thermaerobacter sp.]
MSEVRRLLPEPGVTSAPASWTRMVERGYAEAYARLLTTDPGDIIREVVDSGLAGRGGAAFPTGRKWASVAAAPVLTRYVIMNADESEPGTFKDRVLLEHDPLGPLIGLLIAARAVGARQGYVYLRGEYPDLERTMRQALAVLEKPGWIGPEGVSVEIRRGAGAYIAGEETALFNSIEGRRPEPRVKPPFPATHGLFGLPTLIQNVETLANVAQLFVHGAPWFRQVGTATTPGTKLVAVSGHVTRPGVYEVPFGIPLQTVLDDPQLAAGIAGSGQLQCVLLGGSAGTFLSPPEVAGAVLDYGPLRALGASIGSGAIMVFDHTVEMRRILIQLAAFFADESCGQCVPCRIGTRRLLDILQADALARREPDLRDLASAMRDASICGLGQTAPMALLSAIDRPALWEDICASKGGQSL